MESEIVKTFCELVRIPSPSLEERDAMDYIRNYLKKINIPFREDGAGKKLGGNSGNLIARIGKGRPAIMFVGHVDTVEDGKKKIRPLIKNGIIRSDGTTILGSDDKAGVTALLEALKEVRNKKNLPAVIAVFAVSEEKTPMGVKYLGVSPKEVDFAFDVDGSDRPGKFINKALGYLNFEVRVYGKESHAAIAPEKGRNAIKAAGLIVSSLKLGADAKDGTMNIGRISGGGAMNVVPGYALLEGEARAYDSRHLETKLGEIESAAKKARKITGCTYRFVKKRDAGEAPFQENNDKKIIGIARKASSAAGLKFELKTLRATLQSNILQEKGFNVLGLCKGGVGAHSKEESVSIIELEQAKNIIVKIIEEAATGKANAPKN
ncbi:MAG: M20/M25/M40 family metallo-hydrolase [archaeon]